MFVLNTPVAASAVSASACRATDVWHLVGSPGLLALAHGSGHVSLYSTTGGMVRLSERTAALAVDGVEIPATAAMFGATDATWRFEAGPAAVTRALACDSDAASLHLRWSIDGEAGTRIKERWELSALPLLPAPLMSRPVPVPSTHRGTARVLWRLTFAISGAARAAADALRRRLGRRHPLDPLVDAAAGRLRWAPAAKRTRPRRPRLWLAVPPTVELRVTSASPARCVTLSKKGLTFEVGADGGSVEVCADIRLVDPLLAEGSGSGGGAARLLSETWSSAIADPQLRREARWHVHQLRALRVPDAWSGGRFVMQGSAYAFVHGLHGAPRDEAFVVAALAHLDPPTAREALIAMSAMARSDGTFHYAHTGYGAVLSGGVHAAPTDLPLFYLWAVAEYLAATGDRSVLEEAVGARGAKAADPVRTVGGIAVLAASAIEEQVGFGPHGMLRVGSGDWADPISLMVRNRRAFRRAGESAFNTGMALAVLPMVAGTLDHLDPSGSGRRAELLGRLDAALERAWTGTWYLRGWDGRGGPVGAEHCFLDAQLWPLIAGHGPVERHGALVATVAALCDDPSPIGPTILDRPHRVRYGLLADGWDCNGGVWAALGGLCAWAYALHDPPRAAALLGRMSFQGQREAYPEIWFGQWSGPDARNSAMGDLPGGTFVHPATPMAEFPVMNSNAHAGPLLGLVKAGLLRQS